METLRIALLSTEYPPYPIAGSGTYAVNLVNGLKGHDVTVFTSEFGSAKSEEHSKNVTIKRLKMPFLDRFNNKSITFNIFDKRALLSFAVRKYFKRNSIKDYDLLHAINVNEAIALDYSIKKILPIIISVNDYYALSTSLNPFRFPYKSSDFVFRYFYYNLIKRFNINALRRCNHIIANSNYTASMVVDKAKINNDKCSVVYRGIDIRKYGVRMSTNKYNSNEVLFIGANLERKGVFYLIDAIPIITKEIPSVKFTIIGSTTKRCKNKILNLIDKNDLGNVKLIDYVESKDLPKLYSSANLFIMPSVMEALGQVFMEAMVSRTPVIGTSVGGIPEVVTRECGCLVPPNNEVEIAKAAISILRDPKKAKQMGDAGRKRVFKYFNKDRMVNDTIKVYKDVLSNYL